MTRRSTLAAARRRSGSSLRERVRSVRRCEAAFSLIETLIVVVLMGVVVAAITTAFIGSLSGSDRVQAALPPTRAANSLDLWLASDVSSAVPVNAATWLSITPGDGTGCSGAVPAGSVNVLRVETRNPIQPNASATRYAASYRYTAPSGGATTGTLSRTFCVLGQAPSSSGALVEGIDPAIPPTASIGAAQSSASITLRVRGREAVTVVSAQAAVRVPTTAPPVATSTTTTLAPVQPCSYSSAVAFTGPFARVPGPGNNPRALANTISVSVTTNEASGAKCNQIIASINNVTLTTAQRECALVRSGGIWTVAPATACWGGAAGTWKDLYTISIIDRIDPGDATTSPVTPPTDIALVGPALSISVA